MKRKPVLSVFFGVSATAKTSKANAECTTRICCAIEAILVNRAHRATAQQESLSCLFVGWLVDLFVHVYITYIWPRHPNGYPDCHCVVVNFGAMDQFCGASSELRICFAEILQYNPQLVTCGKCKGTIGRTLIGRAG